MQTNTLHRFLPFLLTTLLFWGCTDEAVNGGQEETAIDGRTELTVGLDFHTLQASLRTRESAYDITESPEIRSAWIGVYDIETGERVGAILSDGSNQIPSQYDSEGYNVNLLYFDAHPTVAIVGVANFDGTTDYEGNSIEELLDNAYTWKEFININVKEESIDTDSPIMMGVLSSSGNNKNASCSLAANGKGVKIENLGEEYIVDLAGGKKTEGIDFTGDIIHTITGKSINLTYLLSQVRVNVVAGNGIEISDISYRIGNRPQAVYLAERPTYTGDAKNLLSYKELSSNYADTFMEKSGNEINPLPLYYTEDENDTWWSDLQGNSFTFTHYENKHWGAYYKVIDSDIHKSREAKHDGSEILKSLCSDKNTQYNNWASYFVVRMKVMDSNNGASGIVEYTIHEGGCNDAYGNSSNEPKDFSCYRNTIYTYNLTVTGLNSIKVNVTGTDFEGKEKEANNGIAGSVYEIKEEVESKEKEGEFTITLPRIEDDKVLLRLYIGNGAGMADDYVYNLTGEELSYFDGVYWPGIRGLAPEISQKILEGFSFYSEDGDEIGDISNFIEEYEGGKTYRVQFKNLPDVTSNPDSYMRAFYVYSPTEESSFTRSSFLKGVLHRCVWYPTVEKIKLPTPVAKDGQLSGNILAESVTINLDPLKDETGNVINPSYYNYEIELNNEIYTYTYTINGTTLVVPSYQLRSDKTNSYTVKAVSNNRNWSDSDPSAPGTVTTSSKNKEWKFSASKWEALLNDIKGGKITYPYTQDNLTLIQGSGTFSSNGYSSSNANANYIQVAGGGAKDKQTFKFTIYKPCRIICKTSSNGNTQVDRYLQVVACQGEKDVYTTERDTYLAGWPNTAPAQVQPVYLQGIQSATDVYVHSQGSGLRFYEIILEEIPENELEPIN